MKKRNLAVNILTAILAVLLSVVLVVALMATSLYNVALTAITPASISDMVQTTVDDYVESPDFEQMILDNEAVQGNVAELGIPAETVGKLMQSEAAHKVIDLLSADFAGALNGSEEVHLTPEALLTIVKEHADELADIAVEMADEPLDKAEIKQQIIDIVEQDSEQLTAMIPDVQSLRTEIRNNADIEPILAMLNPTYLWAAYGVCLLLALLIYACRYYRYGGLMWLGVDVLLVGVSLLVASYGLSAILPTLLSPETSGASGIATSLIHHMSGLVLVQGLILAGVAVLFIVGYILLQTLVLKKKETPTNAPAPTK